MIRLTSLLNESTALTNDFLKKIMNWENGIKSGWNAKKKRWYPHGSVEGGTGTIAYGHKLTSNDFRSGMDTNGITESEAIELLKSDLFAASSKAKQLIPNYKNLPDNVRQALINAAYRGELKSTHQTIKLMNAGKWTAAAAEYLNNAEYNSRPGVRKRMDWNRDQFLTMKNAKNNASDNSTKSKISLDSKTYTVKQGDTLGGIANRNKTTVDAILKKNKGLSADKIKPDQKIFI